MHVLNVGQLRTNIVYMYSSLCLIASVFLNLYVSDIHAVLKIQFFFLKKGTHTVTTVYGVYGGVL